jgi:hypothetical protein
VLITPSPARLSLSGGALTCADLDHRAVRGRDPIPLAALPIVLGVLPRSSAPS